jgi:hypothetical protein
VLPSERHTVSHKETPVASFPPENSTTAFIPPEINFTTLLSKKGRALRARLHHQQKHRDSAKGSTALVSDADMASEDWEPCTAVEVRRKFIKRERRCKVVR